MKATSTHLKDGGVITVSFGKIAYSNPKRRTNAAEVSFGFRSLRGNYEPYFTVTGGIWNSRHTDYANCGATVQEKIQEYVHDDNLQEIIELGKKYHLMTISEMPKSAVARIDEIISRLLAEYEG